MKQQRYKMKDKIKDIFNNILIGKFKDKSVKIFAIVAVIMLLLSITAFVLVGNRNRNNDLAGDYENTSLNAEDTAEDTANNPSSDALEEASSETETQTELQAETQTQTEETNAVTQIEEDSQTDADVRTTATTQEAATASQSSQDTDSSSNAASATVQDFVSTLSAASQYSQLIIVSAHGVTADVSMHELQNGVWTQIMSTQGYVGSEGVGTASEDRSITPAGVYSLTFAFGVNSNPGVAIGYTQVDDSDYWVDDPNSKYYNLFQSINQVTPDWDSAEHLIDYPVSYAYAINIDYNTARVPGAGSAIFLHCSNGKATAGCVAIPQSDMIFVLTHIGSSCAIVIDNADAIMNH